MTSRYIYHTFGPLCFVLFCFFNRSNSIKNVIWLSTVEDSMVVCWFFVFWAFFALAIALKMQYGYWQLKILWLTFLAHGVGIKINGIFCYFPSFNHTFFFFFAYHIPIILVSFHQMWLKKSHQLAFLSEIVGNYEGASLWCLCMAEAKYPTLTKARKKAEQANCLTMA